MPYDFDNNGWKAEGEEWQLFSSQWRSRSMEDVVQSEKIHILVDSDNMHFFVREAYRTLLHNVMTHREFHPQGGVLLTGQPGTGWPVFLNSVVQALTELPPGTTTWLWYFFVSLLANSEDIVLYISGKFHLFHGEQVYTSSAPMGMPHSRNPKRPIWCLIDPDFELKGPPHILFKGGDLRFPVQACSPNGERYKFWFKERRPLVYGMPLWNEPDLLSGYVRYYIDLRCV